MKKIFQSKASWGFLILCIISIYGKYFVATTEIEELSNSLFAVSCILSIFIIEASLKMSNNLKELAMKLGIKEE